VRLAPLDDLTRDHISRVAGWLVLGALSLSLLLIFRRERRPAPPPPADEPSRPPEGARALRLFRLDYGVALERGRLDPGVRRRRTLKTPAGREISWRSPERDFPADPDRPLIVLAAGGRAIASLDPATRRIAFHEADLGALHGLGRRGRALILWPLALATAVFALVGQRSLAALVTSGAGPLPAAYVGSSLLALSALFAVGLFGVLALNLAILSALLRRVRRVQLRRRYEPALRAYLAGLAPPSGP
jgi:hypothetical protein